MFLLLIDSRFYWLSVAYLMIPVIDMIYRGLSERRRNKEYNKIEKMVLPWLMRELSHQKFDASNEDINITYYKEFKRNHLDIRIKLEDHNKNKKTLSNLEDDIQRQIKKNLNLFLIVRVLTEKKN